MAIVRFNPLNEVLGLQREMNRLFDTFAPARRDDEGYESAVWRPVVDVHEDENGYSIDIELPGMKRDDVTINYQDGTLAVSGERRYEHEVGAPASDGDGARAKENGNGDDSGTVRKRPVTVHRVERSYGKFYRSFTFPSAIDEKGIKATFHDGVLNVRVPKAEEVKPRKISID